VPLVTPVPATVLIQKLIFVYFGGGVYPPDYRLCLKAEGEYKKRKKEFELLLMIGHSLECTNEGLSRTEEIKSEIKKKNLSQGKREKDQDVYDFSLSKKKRKSPRNRDRS